MGRPFPVVVSSEGEMALLARSGNGEKGKDKQIVLDSGRKRAGECGPMTQVAPVAGDIIEDYEILEKIGGNMGLVFKARHRLLDKIVALKLFPVDWIADPGRLARFQREMRVMGQLAHPNLVTAADARSVDCWHLVAMEWIDGLDLQQLVRSEGAIPIAEACEAARQAALALQHAHEHGLIHRDIKPSNVMLTRGGTIKVIDMGLALTREDASVQLTHTGLVLGTMTYCAPEQFRDASTVDIRADIYSLGCTLYHLIAGKSPYCERKTFAGIVQAHLNEPFPSLGEAMADAPANLESVIARMTAKEPAARFSTPRAVAEALEPFARGANLERLLRKASQSASRRPNAKPPVTSEPSRPAAGVERRPSGFVAWTAVLVVLLAIGGVAFVLMNRVEADPVVVLMDTTAPGGVYDEENRLREGRMRRNLIRCCGIFCRTVCGRCRFHPHGNERRRCWRCIPGWG